MLSSQQYTYTLYFHHQVQCFPPHNYCCTCYTQTDIYGRRSNLFCLENLARHPVCVRGGGHMGLIIFGINQIYVNPDMKTLFRILVIQMYELLKKPSEICHTRLRGDPNRAAQWHYLTRPAIHPPDHMDFVKLQPAERKICRRGGTRKR